MVLIIVQQMLKGIIAVRCVTLPHHLREQWLISLTSASAGSGQEIRSRQVLLRSTAVYGTAARLGGTDTIDDRY